MADNGTFPGITSVLLALPSCAQNCTLQAASDLTQCNPTSQTELAACLCPDVTELRKITECVQNSCNYPDWEIIYAAHASLCEGFPIPDKGPWFRTIAIAFLSITIPFILLRVYSRMVVTRKYGWDDYTFILASIFSTATLIVMFPLSNLGFGTHYWDINLSNVAPVGILFYVGQLDYVFVQILSKVSILLFFLRIFVTQKWIRLGSYLLLTFLAMKGVIFLFIIIFQCTPIVSTWDRSVPGHCVNTRVLTYLAGALSIFEDFLTLCLPIPCLSALNIGRGKKATAILMFSIGSLACIFSIVRLRFLMKFGGRVDTTYEDVDAFAWSVIENSLALICACLPALRPILSVLSPHIFGESSQRRRRHSKHFRLPDVANRGKVDDWEAGLKDNASATEEDSIEETERGEHMAEMVVISKQHPAGTPRLVFCNAIGRLSKESLRHNV